MRTLIMGLVVVACVGCVHTHPAREIAGSSSLNIKVTDASPPQRHDCPDNLTGLIQGRVVLPEPRDTSVHVIFLMSDDATVDVVAAADGSFEIPCIYPAPSYGICVVSQGARACASAAGPQAIGLELTVTGPGG
jgi:hypothetical protein